MAASQVEDVELKDIVGVDDSNVRHSVAESDLKELADNIRKNGLLQPIVLRGTFGNPQYTVVIGQRRFLAYRDILNAKRIPATFAGPLSDEQVALKSLAENMCRVGLSYKDAADAITKLYTHFGRDTRRVSRETGLSARKINLYVYIEERASPKTKRLLREGRVEPADVQRAIRAASEDIDKADQLLDLMQKYKLPTPAKKRMVEYAQEHPGASAETIVKKASEPVVEREILVRLTDSGRRALIKAAGVLSMEPDEVATKAVEEWLTGQGFMQ